VTETHHPHTDQQIAERAVVVQLLRQDHDGRWSCAELRAELSDIEPWALARAVERLLHDGVLEATGDYVLASRAARRLDELHLIGV
jgi:DNA-binding HxlR family transcriptional regulator